MPRAANLERADGLQHFGLAPNRYAIHLKRQQGRFWQNSAYLGHRPMHPFVRGRRDGYSQFLFCHKRPLYACAERISDKWN